MTAHEDVIFQPDGKIAAIRNSWVFDDMYSAFAVQGLAKDGQLATKEQLAPLDTCGSALRTTRRSMETELTAAVSTGCGAARIGRIR